MIELASAILVLRHDLLRRSHSGGKNVSAQHHGEQTYSFLHSTVPPQVLNPAKRQRTRSENIRSDVSKVHKKHTCLRLEPNMPVQERMDGPGWSQ